MRPLTIQPYFGQKNYQLHYMDCDSFLLSFRTQNIINDLKNLGHLLDFSNLDVNHEIFSNKKEVGNFKIETPKNIWSDEFISLRSKAYSFKCNDKNTNKLKGISESYSTHSRSEQYKKMFRW